MQMYFDESGDTGDVKRKSNTKLFTVVIYIEKDKIESEIFLNTFKKSVNKKTTDIKWFKLNKKAKLEFIKIHKSISKKVFVITCDKTFSPIFGENLFLNMLKDLIIKNKLYGKYKYEGIHLKKILNKVKIEIKKSGLKVDFENVKTENNLGIQICDLFAGMTNELVFKNETLNLENLYYFKYKN